MMAEIGHFQFSEICYWARGWANNGEVGVVCD